MSVIVLIGAACLAQDQPQPYSVKADRLGETLDAWLANNPHIDSCYNNTVDSKVGSAEDPDVRFCFARSGEEPTFATAPLTNMTAWFFKGHLFKVEMHVWNRNWSGTVLSALRDKYGVPKVEVTPLQNGFGAKFDMNTYTWTNGVSTIEFNDYTPSVVVTLDVVNNEITDRQRRAQQDKAKSDT